MKDIKKAKDDIDVRLIKCSRPKEVGYVDATRKKRKGIRKTLPFLSLSIKIFKEFWLGFRFIDKYHFAVTFFGSARESLPERYYKESEELARFFVKNKFAVATGGAGGIMRSANKGAYKAKGDSVGVNIYIPQEQQTNTYLTDSKDFDFFFSRKTILSYASEIYIYFPGGFGTLDEFFEIITLIQTNKIPKIPIILYGKEYWTPIIKMFEETLLKKYKTISKEDTDLYVLANTPQEVKDYVATLNFIDGEEIIKIDPSL